MPQKNYLKKHLQAIVKELGKIQTTVCDTDNTPAKELVILHNKYQELQECLKWIGWLDKEINSESDVKATLNGKDNNSGRIITL